MRERSHSEISFWRTTVAVRGALVLALGACGSLARGSEGELDARCRADAEEARAACTTTDMKDAHGKVLLDVVNDTNDAIPGQESDGSVARGASQPVRGANQAARYANRKNNSQALAELAKMKAESCQTTSKKCRISCAIAEREHRSGATVFSAIEIGDQAGRESQLASARANDGGICRGYRANVEAAYRQSFAMASNKSVNESGVGSTSADDSRLPLVNAAPVASGVAPDVAPIRVGGAANETVAPTFEVAQQSIAAGDARASASRAPASIRVAAGGGVGVAVGGVQVRKNLEGSANAGHQIAVVHGGRADGVSGMSLPAVDGMTGPLGPSLFEKISNQYQQQDRNFIQERSVANQPAAR